MPLGVGMSKVANVIQVFSLFSSNRTTVNLKPFFSSINLTVLLTYQKQCSPLLTFNIQSKLCYCTQLNLTTTYDIPVTGSMYKSSVPFTVLMISTQLCGIMCEAVSSPPQNLTNPHLVVPVINSLKRICTGYRKSVLMPGTASKDLPIFLPIREMF